MDLTRITEKNAAYFEDILPSEMVKDDDIVSIGLVDKGRALSALSLSMFERTAYLEWICTDEDVRGEGYASKLMDTAIDLVQSIDGIEGIEASFTDEDDYVEELLGSKGFLVSEDEDIYCVPIYDLIYSERMEEFIDRQLEAGKSEIKTSDLKGKGALSKLGDYLSLKGYPISYYTSLSLDHSLVCIEDNEVKGCILISELDEKDYKVELILNDLSIKGLSNMFCKLYEILSKEDKTDGYLFFTDRADHSVKIVENLTGNDSAAYKTKGMMHAIRLF